MDLVVSDLMINMSKNHDERMGCTAATCTCTSTTTPAPNMSEYVDENASFAEDLALLKQELQKYL